MAWSNSFKSFVHWLLAGIRSLINGRISIILLSYQEDFILPMQECIIYMLNISYSYPPYLYSEMIVIMVAVAGELFSSSV